MRTLLERHTLALFKKNSDVNKYTFYNLLCVALQQHTDILEMFRSAGELKFSIYAICENGVIVATLLYSH